MFMKKSILMILSAAFFLNINTACASIDAEKAEAFVKQVTENGVEDIINAQISQKEKDARFEKLFNSALDLNYIGKFVLGRYWKTASEQQKNEFISAYRAMNIKTWSRRFDEFKGKRFDFRGTSPSNTSNQVFVNTTVPMDQGEPAKVVWRVKQTGDKFKVVDIIIENVSLAITARNEYTAYIKNNPGGIDALIKDLKNKSK